MLNNDNIKYPNNSKKGRGKMFVWQAILRPINVYRYKHKISVVLWFLGV